MTSKKTLLIAGGGHSDIPLIKASKALGFFVVTSGNRPEDLGHRHSDRFYPIDFSNLTAMLELAQTLRIDAICAGCNDFAALTAAYVAEKMGLPGHDSFETTKIIHHKDQYRNFALKNGKELWVQDRGVPYFEAELHLQNQRPDLTDGTIVECGYGALGFFVEKIRTDKIHANNRRTYMRTMVNLRENIKIEEILPGDTKPGKTRPS